MKQERNTADALAELINAELGEGTVQVLEPGTKQIREGLSSGSVKLNLALSGYPLVGYVWGRIVEIYGPEQSGKTTLALHAIAEAQKLGYVAGFVDAEHALDPEYAARIGVKRESLLFNQPDYGEQAISVCLQMLKSGAKVVVVDSVAALTPKAEIEGGMEDQQMGLQGRMMGKALRKLVGANSKTGALLIFINQIRDKLGIVFGNSETTPGGKALKFFASYRLEVRSPRGGAEKGKKSVDGEEGVETGTRTKIKIVKNKLYPPFRTAELHIVYGKGIDKPRDVAACLLATGIASKRDLLGKAYANEKKLAFALRESEALRRKAFFALKEYSSDPHSGSSLRSLE